MPWVIGVAVAGCLGLLIVVFRAAYRSMRRCVFCRQVTVPLFSRDEPISQRIFNAVAAYEGSEPPQSYVMACDGCRTIFNVSPRGYATVAGTMRMSKDDAIMNGVRLQVDDFRCHSCGYLLVETDSPSVRNVDRDLVEEGLVNCDPSAEGTPRLFCRECKALHLWVPIRDTGYKFLRAYSLCSEDRAVGRV